MEPEIAAKAKERQEATKLAGKDEEGNPVTKAEIGASDSDAPKGRTDEIIAGYVGEARSP